MKIALFEVEDWERGTFSELETDDEVASLQGGHRHSIAWSSQHSW